MVCASRYYLRATPPWIVFPIPELRIFVISNFFICNGLSICVCGRVDNEHNGCIHYEAGIFEISLLLGLYNNFTSRVFGEIVSMFLITGDDFCSMLTSKCIYSPKDIRI
jgi:hypothetical protein